MGDILRISSSNRVVSDGRVVRVMGGKGLGQCQVAPREDSEQQAVMMGVEGQGIGWSDTG